MDDGNGDRRHTESERAILYRLDERTKRIDNRIGRVDERIDELDATLAQHDGRLDTQQREIDRNTLIINAVTFGLGTAVATVTAKLHGFIRIF